MADSTEPILSDKKEVRFSICLDETLHRAILADVKAARAARRETNKSTVIREILNAHYFSSDKKSPSKNKPTPSEN